MLLEIPIAMIVMSATRAILVPSFFGTMESESTRVLRLKGTDELSPGAT